MPLYIAAFCIFAACKRSGIGYGALCALASAGLMFLMTGLSVKWLLFVVMFAPYGMTAYALDKLSYFKVKTAILRAALAIVFFNVTLGIVYAIVINVASVGMQGINLTEWSATVGGYAVLAVIATVILVPLDFILYAMSKVVFKRLPGFGERKKPPVGEDKDAEAHENTKKVDDVFGYEVFDKDEDKKNDNDK